MSIAAYRELLATARRETRRADEAEDLVQDALLVGLAAGRADLDSLADRRWLKGVIRNKARLSARTAARQRLRETGWHALSHATEDADTSAPGDTIAILPPSLRIVATLAMTGHSRREIAYLLGLSDTALRQRLSGLRRHFAQAGLTLPRQTPGLSFDLAYGRIRDTLLGKLLREGGLFASHDPDGHLFIVRRSQTG